MNQEPYQAQSSNTQMNLWDYSIAGGLFLFVLISLLVGLSDPGVTWDEAYPNFDAAKRQAQWFSSLASLESPFSQETIDHYWQTTSDHPSLPRSIAAFSHLIFTGLVDEVTALRIPSAIVFSLLVASIYLFLRNFLSLWGALAGALSLVMMPRIFGHAHLFSLDVPIMVWWFWGACTGFLVVKRGWHPLWFAAVYAVAFATKLHSVFLPFPLLFWAALQLYIDPKNWKKFAWAVALSAIIVPLFYVVVQPWLWHDTFQRIVERFFDYAAKASTNPIRLFYFGTLYMDNTPWHYPLVMVALTIPLFLFLLLLVGYGVLIYWRKGSEQLSWQEWCTKQEGIGLFLLLTSATPLALVLLPLAQGYDGCRLILPFFPFAACIIGFGFEWLSNRMARKLPSQVVLILLFALLTLPSLINYRSIHPYYLAYYNEIAGGAAGARRMGMESTYWCDALTKDFLDKINTIVKPGQTMRPLSMSFSVIAYYKERGWLRPDINHLAEPPYDFHLLQCRQGMFTRAEWFLYKNRRPLAMVHIDNVPLFALYGPFE